MRIRHDQLIFKALVALDEAAKTAGDPPTEPSRAVRFALAFLYAASEGDCLWIYRGYWKALCGVTLEPGEQVWLRDYCRRRDLDGAMLGISRSVGIEWSLECEETVRRAWRKT